MFFTTRRLTRLINEAQSRANDLLEKIEFSMLQISVGRDGFYCAVLDNCHYHDGSGQGCPVDGFGYNPIIAVKGVLERLDGIISFSKLMSGKDCTEACRKLSVEIIPAP